MPRRKIEHYRRVGIGEQLEAMVSMMSARMVVIAIYTAIMVPYAIYNGVEAVGETRERWEILPGFGISENFTGRTLPEYLTAALHFLFDTAMHFLLYGAMMIGRATPQLHRFFPYLIVYVVALAFVVLGLMALIVPGLILLARWGLVTPLAAGTDTPIRECFTKSWAMTENSGWAILWTFVILLFASIAVDLIITSAIIALVGDGDLGTQIGERLSDCVLAIAVTAWSVGLYKSLHDDLQELVEVFE